MFTISSFANIKIYMKYLSLILVFCLITVSTSGQKKATGNFYSAIKNYDLSKLWHGEKLHIENGEVPSINFPEPVGFIGENYYRFYIHYTSVIKDKSDPYKYLIQGKTRVNNNICDFYGTIKIVQATIDNNLYYEKYKQGVAICIILFKEDSTQHESGIIKGKLTTNFYIDKKGKIFYDTLDSEADGFDNNDVEATWTNYVKRKTKKCNWGDFRIPDSGYLDGGAGEFMVSEKYIKNGWENYMNMFSADKKISKKAIAEENRKWWE